VVVIRKAIKAYVIFGMFAFFAFVFISLIFQICSRNSLNIKVFGDEYIYVSQQKIQNGIMGVNSYIFVLDKNKLSNFDYFSEDYYDSKKFSEISGDEGIIGQYIWSVKRGSLVHSRVQNEIDMNKDIEAVFSKNCFVVSIHSNLENKLSEHVVDYLFYLEEKTQTADIIYKCMGMQRIIYGTKEFVLIYDGQEDRYKYIDIASSDVLYEVKADIKNRDYIFKLISNENKNEYIYLCRNTSFLKDIRKLTK
jgi:hypothetical protein